ncbi:MAG: alpha/beta hydrolase [Nanoarchaeota archaeon]|nr:alpha/beta hydrolase [Nanoarchaeota archaeon]
MKYRAILIHGYAGVPKDAWRPWLRDELEKRGFLASLPSMPHPNHPKEKEWVKKIKKEVKHPDENTFLVGHSLGCIAILRYLESLGTNEKISGAVFVAGFSDDLNIPVLSPFFETPIKWEAIKTHCKRFTAIYSDNDQWVPMRHAEIFKEKLNAEIILRKGMKHFSTDDEVEESLKLPSALTAILNMAKVA